MTRLEDRQTLAAEIAAASAAGARLAPACSLAGIDVRTFQRWLLVSSPGAARAWARQRSSVPTLTPTSRETTSTAELEAWKHDAIAGLGEPRAASAVEARQDRRRVKELERELHGKDKALAETTALLVLRKKLDAVFREGEDE